MSLVDRLESLLADTFEAAQKVGANGRLPVAVVSALFALVDFCNSVATRTRHDDELPKGKKEI